MIKTFLNSLTPPFIKQIVTVVRVRLQKKPEPIWVTLSSGRLKGIRFFIDPISTIGKDYLNGHDEFIYTKLDKYKSIASPVFYDIGAHFGLHTLAFSLIAGKSGKVYAFEPHPLNKERLTKNISENIALCNNIIVIDKAITDYKGSVNFEMITDLESGWSSSSRILKENERTKDTDVKRNIEVATDALDNLVDDGTILKPDFIKIDVEGEEFKVLKGAIKTLLHFKPVLFIEIHSIECMYLIQNELNELGYKVDLLHIEPDGRCFISGEILH